MPLPGDLPRLCLIGDSHLASVRRAYQSGVLDLPEYDVEFWGAYGPYFRGMVLQNGNISVRGKEARGKFAEINGRGRTRIAPGDFDLLVLYGCRIRSFEFLGRHLQYRSGDIGWQSRAALRASAHGFLVSSRAYRIAASFAQENAARVWCVPDPLLTAGVLDHSAPGQFLDRFPAATEATGEERAELWSALVAAAADDGVRFVPQPEDTIVEGVFTDPVYAVDEAREKQDAGHKSPEFAARMLAELASNLAEARRAVSA